MFIKLVHTTAECAVHYFEVKYNKAVTLQLFLTKKENVLAQSALKIKSST